MELEYAKELDRILGALQGPIPKKYQKGNEKTGGQSLSEITKFKTNNGLNQYLVVINSWEVDHLVEELQITRVNLCGYLEILESKGFVKLWEGAPEEIYGWASVKVAGIHFYRNGGFTKVATDEVEKRLKEKEILDQELKAAQIGAAAAKDSAEFSKYLLGVTALNVLAVLITTYFEIEDFYDRRNFEEESPAAKTEEILIRIPTDTLRVNQEKTK